MKNLIFSLFTFLLVFGAQQTATAQNDKKTLVEATELVESVQENKATLEAQLQKGVVLHDIAKKQKQLAASKFYDDVLTSLRGLQNIGKRVERAGVKMSQQELEVFKNELTSSMTKFESLATEQPQSTKPASAVSCGTACIEKYRQWWQFFARQACMIACMFG